MIEKIKARQILEYADKHGNESAANILLLIGYDGYDGTVEDYDKLMNILNQRFLEEGK